jgi:hypothetical protein
VSVGRDSDRWRVLCSSEPLVGSRFEAVSIFQTVSEGRFSEVRVRQVLRPSLLEQTDPHQAALKNTMADAPTTTTTKTSITMAGSSTTRSALPVLVECISRIPTVAR